MNMRRTVWIIVLLAAAWPSLLKAQSDGAGGRARVLAQSDEFAPGTLAYHLSTNAVARTAGISDIYGGSMELSGWRYATFRGQDMAALTNSVWSTNFWLRGVRGLPATCIGFSNSMGGQGLMSMVSPRHFLCSTHMHPEGYRTAFLDTNNIIHWRRTLQRVDVGRDTSVGILDADLPPSVGYLPVMPMDFTNYLPPEIDVHFQGIGMNQDMRLFGEPMHATWGMYWNATLTAPFGLSTNWNVEIRGGDSSDPAFVLIGNQLVLVSHNSISMGGPSYADFLDAINEKMCYLSTNNAVGTDYQLTQMCLTNWPVIRR
jgi:hypothetical protein